MHLNYPSSLIHGILVRLTRENFLRNIELNTQSLIPRPVIIVIIGSDLNRYEPGLETYFGTSYADLDAFRDRDIKSSLQRAMWALKELRSPSVSVQLQRAATELLPPSHELVRVLEVIYILQTSAENQDHIRKPDEDVPTIGTQAYEQSVTSWRAMQGLLHDPYALTERLARVCGNRGPNFHLIEVRARLELTPGLVYTCVCIAMLTTSMLCFMRSCRVRVLCTLL